MAQCNSDSVVLLTARSESKQEALHLLRRHRHLAHSKRIYLSLSENRLHSKQLTVTHYGLALSQTIRQSSTRRSQSTAHDIGSGKNKLDGTLVHLHALHHIGRYTIRACNPFSHLEEAPLNSGDTVRRDRNRKWAPYLR